MRCSRMYHGQRVIQVIHSIGLLLSSPRAPQRHTVPRLGQQAECPSKRRTLSPPRVFSRITTSVAFRDTSTATSTDGPRCDCEWPVGRRSDVVHANAQQPFAIVSASGSLRFPTNDIYDDIKRIQLFVSSVFCSGHCSLDRSNKRADFPYGNRPLQRSSDDLSSRGIGQPSNERHL